MAKKKMQEKRGIKRVEELEEEQIKELKKVEKSEERVEKELEKFEKEISSLKKQIKPEIIEKFTYKDIARGVVGSIFGMSVMSWHEVVIEGAKNMPWAGIFLMVVLTVIAGTSVLYFSQYRRIRESWIIHHLLPKRFIIFYALSLLIVTVSYLLFGIIEISATPWHDAVKLVLVLGLPAMIGASAADIIR